MCQLLGSHRDKDDSMKNALKYRITIFFLCKFVILKVLVYYTDHIAVFKGLHGNKTKNNLSFSRWLLVQFIKHIKIK